ncbi:bacteriohemerythrin [Reinekea sp. G2M2-21]|uniref:bacteriohemerythrin n=1 Tax=Reinekea sp. G2M2-21 TaxID=2788942 RepID=UPI0018AB2745|nr:bacteriohemerythrin [Reinekea sp. G2M2-21]
MKIQWSTDYELGIGVIDAQHKRIVEYINDVHDIAENRGGREEIDKVLHLLVDYTLSHFAFEEALLEESGYAELPEHQVTHRMFEKQIQVLQERFANGDDVAIELADVLQDWLLKHIMTDDQSYRATVKNRFLNSTPEKHASWIKRATKRFFS